MYHVKVHVMVLEGNDNWSPVLILVAMVRLPQNSKLPPVLASRIPAYETVPQLAVARENATVPELATTPAEGEPNVITARA